MFMDYGGKESESQSILILPMPPKSTGGGGKRTIEQHLASLPESRLRVLLSLADTLQPH